MNSRRCKRSGSVENVPVSFVEVKVEPDVLAYECSESLPSSNTRPRHARRSSKVVNKCVDESQAKKPKTKETKTHCRRSRATQVNSEDIDIINVRKFDALNTNAENKPIRAIGTESVIPQCRFCLRRVSRENLKIILRKQSITAHAAFQIRVFHHDAYPLACVNCLNMIDIILDYKSAVTKARNLLLDKRTHLENDGWDDPVNVGSFNQCKSAIEKHRMQIDAIYDDHLARDERRNTQILEPKMELSIEDNATSDTRNDTIHFQNASTANSVHEESTSVQFSLEPGIGDVESILQAVVEDVSVDSGSIINAGDGFELPAANSVATPPNTESLENENGVPSRSRRKAKEKKVYYSSESEQSIEDIEDDDYDPGDANSSENDDDDLVYIPVSLTSEIPEVSVPKKRKYNKMSVLPRKPRAKEQHPRKRRKPRESGLDYKSPPVQPVLCDLCGESVRPETIEGHRNRHLGIKPYNCPVEGCNWAFHGRAHMSRHMRRVHPQNGAQYQKCDICGRFVRGLPNILNEHKKLHFLKKDGHVCPVCGKGFATPRYLRQHSIIHTGLFPYECSYCGKKFNNKWSMKTHEKNIHEKKNALPTSHDSVMEQSGQAYME
ncbi:zinc finger and SCAN domain-containing protein 5B [Aedes albopictus]|uniref:C2H2-type domain-containing protein n=1 Tax=Aedes albopictus TaxID=7160 RepID=A0ABM1XIP4_AEDAL|nr:zinc finger and SCAN domain-containing protein 5B [Aedes albopictus]